MINSNEYVRAKKILDVHKRLMGIQMNETKFEKAEYERLINELEQELTELKNKGEN